MQALTFPHRQDAALAWLRRSIEATGGRGSAHSYSPLWGWAKAYPETTGYLIETLLRYAAARRDEALRRLALDCARWLLDVQLPSGAFPALLAGSTRPSVFNTAQILFGLVAAAREFTGEADRFEAAARRAAAWLLQVRDPGGGWRLAAYVPGFEPSYYTRALWGLLMAGRFWHDQEIENAARRELTRYAGRFTPAGTVRDWGFRPGARAFTHTLAYTYEGFFECACLLEDGDVLEKTVHALRRLWAVRQQADRTAGRYDLDWRGDYRFLCPTGNAQLSALYRRVYETTGDTAFREAAGAFLDEILPHQSWSDDPGRRGALPGSVPFWGPYLRFRYPNWGVKFLLDALLI